jgi:hypothetical protein
MGHESCCIVWQMPRFVLVLLSCAGAAATRRNASSLSDACEHTSVCSLGKPKNVTNATGVCIHNPFYPGTSVCEICDGCPWPECPCCNPLYNQATACSLCQVQNQYFRSKCGNPSFAFKCDHSAETDPCQVVPGSVSQCQGSGFACYATHAECSASCNATYNCLNSEKCVESPQGTTGKFPTLSSCKAACGQTPPTPAPKSHYGNPTLGCRPDEENTTAYGLSGDFCSAACEREACPTDVPVSVSAKPVCAQLIGGSQCVLRCTPNAESGQCGDANCQAMPPSPLPSTGICTYST